MIQGSLVALVTPMFEDGSVDYDALAKLIEWHIASGTDGIVSVGTTGESPTLSVEEHNAVIAFTVKTAAGRIPVIAGTGGNSTAEAIELTAAAKAAGADASLQVVPYYNKPTQEGLYRHFKTIAEAVDIPIILYNVPAAPCRLEERHRAASCAGAGHRGSEGRHRRPSPAASIFCAVCRASPTAVSLRCIRATTTRLSLSCSWAARA